MPNYDFIVGMYVIKTWTISCWISLCWRTHSLSLCRAILPILQTREISLHKHNWCVLPRLTKHSLVLVILWPHFMWYTGMWSPNGDQSGQWTSTSITSQWSLIMTSQWLMMLLGMHIVQSQWIMTLLYGHPLWHHHNE